jgi:3-isopropylmalate dehydrogenase
MEEAAAVIEDAVNGVLNDGLRTADISEDGVDPVGTAEMGDAVAAKIML